MSVKIRLARMGAKKRPFYRIVITNSTSPRDGKYIEIVGTYNPHPDPAEIKLDEGKIKEWIKKGAKPTQTVKSILKKGGIIAPK